MKVGVIMGGISSEREVSLNTGREILKALDKTKYDACPVVINSKQELADSVKELDVAFIALHDKYGEDGTVQGMLETLGIPYTGCGVLPSAVCMDKDLSKHILRQGGLNTADWHIVKSVGDEELPAAKDLGYPVVVKPNSGGSSVATSIARGSDELAKAVAEALRYDIEVMIEQYIDGDEITCPVLDGRLLPVLAIKPKAGFFDYTSKYTEGEAEEYVVELEEPIRSKVAYMTLKAYGLLKCRAYARVDMIISDGEPYILEVNTLPGMTMNSLFPKSAVAAGISFSHLLDLIIDCALRERAGLRVGET